MLCARVFWGGPYNGEVVVVFFPFFSSAASTYKIKYQGGRASPGFDTDTLYLSHKQFFYREHVILRPTSDIWGCAPIQPSYDPLLLDSLVASASPQPHVVLRVQLADSIKHY
jgi:hypothetical protein